MRKLIIDRDFLYEMDKHCRIDDVEKCEQEIENIVSNLWMNIGDYQELMEPAFTTFLQTNLLRPLYICYFSMAELIQHYDEIVIKDSTILLDIVASYFQVDLPKDRKNHDIDFGLIRFYSFNTDRKRGVKGFLRRLYCFTRIIRGLDVLYINSGKLSKDFSFIEKSMSVFNILQSNKMNSIDVDINCIIDKSISSVKRNNISVPQEILVNLLYKRVYCYLKSFFLEIDSYLCFIKLYNIKLIIISGATHEDGIALMAAANLAGIKSLSIGHGVTSVRNKFLDYRINYQGTINDLEYKYIDAHQFNLKMRWFEEL